LIDDYSRNSSMCWYSPRQEAAIIRQTLQEENCGYALRCPYAENRSSKSRMSSVGSAWFFVLVAAFRNLWVIVVVFFASSSLPAARGLGQAFAYTNTAATFIVFLLCKPPLLAQRYLNDKTTKIRASGGLFATRIADMSICGLSGGKALLIDESTC
jgi:hypothetical protein